MQMESWKTLTELKKDAPKSEVTLALQNILFDLNAGPGTGLMPDEVKTGLLASCSLCYEETKLQVKWCQLAVLALNATQCIFKTSELNECATFIIGACKATNYMYCTVEALGALLYNVDLNCLRSLDGLLGEGGMILQLVLGKAPEREVQHLALRCLNNMLNSVTDPVFVTNIVTTLSTLSTSKLHGDNLNRARLSAGIMKCLQTIARHNSSQYLLEQILSVVKGNILDGVTESRAVSLESLSLDDLTTSDLNEPGHMRYSQPRVRNKKARGKRRKPENESNRFDSHNKTPESSWRTKPTNRPKTKPNQNQNRFQPLQQQRWNEKAKPTSPVVEPQQQHGIGDKNMAYNPELQTNFAVSTSESEVSESDTDEGMQSKVLAVRCRTRLATLQTLQHCISTVHKSKSYSLWSAFLPSDPSAGLLPVLAREQHVKCKIAGYGALTSLIESTKHYFVAADSRPALSGRAPYTPFSASLSSDLVMLHAQLIGQISGCAPGALPHLFQCIATLVIHTPFSKLPPHLVADVLEACAPYVTSPGQYKSESGALALLCACLSVETPLPAVETWLLSHSSVVGTCLQHLNQINHQKDVLQILCQIMRFYFTPLVRWWREVTEGAKMTLSASQDTLVQNMALLVLEEEGRALANHLDKGGEGLQAGALREHWLDILSTVVVPIMQNENSQIMPGACDILSTIGNTVFCSFEVHTQRLIMTLLLALTSPAVPSTSSACRCLGVLVMYPCIRDDLLFVADTANAIISALESSENSGDAGLLLRVSWSLGNLSDTLVVNKLNSPSFVEDFSDLLLGRLLDVSLKCAQTNDKVRSNVVRALGNLLRFLKQSTHDKAHFREFVNRSVKCILNACTSGMMKTRWNACHAVVNLLQNPVLAPATAPWAPDLFSTLTSVLNSCKNYKVRINASQALAQCQTRACYGTHFGAVWKSVFWAISDEGPGGGLCGYTDKLRTQLLVLLCHLTVLHTPADLPVMVIPPAHTHAQIVAHCIPLTTSAVLSTSDKELVARASAVCAECMPTLGLLYKMVVPRQLPSDTEAFVTHDISRNSGAFK